jgi:hypothetical protein
MAVRPRQAVVVGQEPIRLDLTPTDPPYGGRAGSAFLGVAQGAGELVLGGDNGVVADDGCRVPCVRGTQIAVDLDHGEEVWGVVASGSVTIDVLMSGA